MSSEVCNYIEGYGSDHISSKEHWLEDPAVSVGLASCPGLDWLREIVSVLGRRLKVHQSLRAPSENQVKLKFNTGFLIGSLCIHCRHILKMWVLIMKTVSYSLLDFKSVAQKLLLVSQPLQLPQYVNRKIEFFLVHVRDAIWKVCLCYMYILGKLIMSMYVSRLSISNERTRSLLY